MKPTRRERIAEFVHAGLVPRLCHMEPTKIAELTVANADALIAVLDRPKPAPTPAPTPEPTSLTTPLHLQELVLLRDIAYEVRHMRERNDQNPRWCFKRLDELLRVYPDALSKKVTQP